ncbi:four helix bundle protein [Candidatus Kaiserbacteria bacterium]|nr:four helix bundle protein [Candidatus Kaiserbacteria bacterium]
MARDERFGIGNRIDVLLLDLLEDLRTAGYARANEKPTVLARALHALDSIRFFLQIAWESKLIANKQYENLAVRIEEIGKMTGGWRKGILAKTPPIGGERKE